MYTTCTCQVKSEPHQPGRNGVAVILERILDRGDWCFFRRLVCTFFLTCHHSPRLAQAPFIFYSIPVSGVCVNMAASTREPEPELRKEGKEKQKLPLTVTPTQTGVWLQRSQALFADFGLGGLGSTRTVADAQNGQQVQSPAVRFKSTIEEISANDAAPTSHPLAAGGSLGEPGQVTPEQIRDLADRLRTCPLQERRMNIFSYEPVSLPVSRVCVFFFPGRICRTVRQR